MNKKSVLSATTVIILVLIVLSAIFALSIAYLSSVTNTQTNEFSIGSAEVTIDENFDGWQAKEIKLAIETGENNVPCYARVMIVPYILDGEGNYISCDLGELYKPVNNKMELGDVILEFASDWSSNWTFRDGFFYYNSVLYPTTAGGANETSLLLTKVSLSEDARQKYGEEAYIKIEILADILQAEGNAGQEWGL